MSLSGINSAGEAYIYISANDDGLTKGLNVAQKAIQNFADQTKDVDVSLFSKLASESVFAGIKSLFSSATESFMGYGDQFEKMSQRTGMGTEALTQYAYVAEMCGTNIETLEGAIRETQKVMGEAALGSADAAGKLNLIGTSYEELKNLSPEEQFQKMLKAVAQISDPTQRAATAMKLFSDAGSQLMPMLNAGAEGLDQYVKEAIDSGKVMSQESASQAAALSDATGRVKASFEGLGLTLSENFVPMTTKAFQLLGNGLNVITSFAKECPRLTTGLTAVTTGITGLSVISYATVRFIDFSKVIRDNIVSIALWIKTIFSVQTATKIWTACNAALTFSLKGVQIAIATISAHPIIAVATALAAVAAGYLIWSKTSKKHVGEAVQDVETLKSKLDEMNSGASSKFQFLENLAKKQRLTNQELVDAVRILKELQGKYGDVGVSIDQMTGRVVIAANAQDKLNAAMRDQAIAQTKLAINAKEKEVAQDTEDWDRAVIDYAGWESEKNKNIMDEAELRLNASESELNALRAQLESFENGGTVGNPVANPLPNESGTVGEPGEYEKYLDDFRRSNLAELDRKIEDENRAAQKILDIEKDRFDKGLQLEEDYNNRVMQINNIADEKIRKLKEESAKKIADEEAKIAKESQDKYNEAVKAVEESSLRMNQAEASELDQKIDAIRTETNEHKKALQSLLNLEVQKPQADQTLVKSLQDQLKQADQTGNNRIQNEIDEALKQNRFKEIDQLIAAKNSELAGAVRSGDAGRVETIQGELDDLNYQKSSGQLEDAIKERDLAYQELKKAQSTGNEQLIANAWEKVNGRETSFQAALNEMKNLTGRDVSPGEVLANEIESGLAQSESTSSKGTFNALEASQLGGTGYEKKMAENSDKTTEYLRQINTKVDQQTARFA